MNEYDRNYFQRTLKEIPGYWKRFGGMPDVTGKMVMDLGCGQGAMCVDIAQAGAAKVVGIDTDDRRINFARENLAENYAQLADSIEFQEIWLKDYPDEPVFDYVVSKNTFEHVFGLPEVLQDVKTRLKVGGRLYSGYGPLYRAPYGDHKVVNVNKMWNPWGHLLKSDAEIIREYNARGTKHQIETVDDLGMNRLTYKEHHRILHESGMKVVYFRTNAVGKQSMKRRVAGAVMDVMAAIPPLREYFTANIYVVLEKV
jgi:SAM-dependent methyltransferase